MSRIILNYDDKVDIEDAMLTVFEVIKMGRISKFGKSFCLCTRFKDGIVVFADITRKGTDKFNVISESQDT